MLQYRQWGGISHQHDLQSALTLHGGCCWLALCSLVLCPLLWAGSWPGPQLPQHCWDMIRMEARRAMGKTELPALGSFVMPDPSTLL